MKKIMQLAGVEGKQVLFYFPDNHIVDERFLEDVNNVLNAGEVPNLFEADERQKVLDGTAPAVRALGMDDRMRQRAVISHYISSENVFLASSYIFHSLAKRYDSG